MRRRRGAGTLIGLLLTLPGLWLRSLLPIALPRYRVLRLIAGTSHVATPALLLHSGISIP